MLKILCFSLSIMLPPSVPGRLNYFWSSHWPGTNRNLPPHSWVCGVYLWRSGADATLLLVCSTARPCFFLARIHFLMRYLSASCLGEKAVECESMLLGLLRIWNDKLSYHLRYWRSSVTYSQKHPYSSLPTPLLNSLELFFLASYNMGW